MTAGATDSTTYREWQPGPRQPRLPQGSVDVWRADLATVSDEVLATLSSDEQARAERLLSPQHARIWALCRGVLRTLVARYLDTDAQQLRFVTGEHGKPALAGDHDASDARRSRASTYDRLYFNLSHSRELALYAFSTVAPVGVDVEVAGRAVDELAISTRLGVAEAHRLAELDPPMRARAFLRSWVRLEADVKRRGTGLGLRREDGTMGDAWVADLEVGLHAAAAVAIERRPIELRCWAWTEAPGGRSAAALDTTFTRPR